MCESPFLKIALVGAGSVATHLGLALKHAGLSVEYVLNRSSESGILLADKLGARYISSYEKLGNPDLLIVAVSDDAIPALAGKFSGCSFPIVHTSGTVSKDVLSIVGSDYGVFYPLQSFSMGRCVDFSKVPICIDSSNPLFTQKLVRLADFLSAPAYQIGDQQRKILHLAAVFASNFSNFLYAVSADILKDNDIPFEILHSLIQETANKIQTIAPLDAQTGPARRCDVSTIQQHLQMLQNKPEMLKLYELLTDNILRLYSHPFSTSHILSEDDKK